MQRAWRCDRVRAHVVERVVAEGLTLVDDLQAHQLQGIDPWVYFRDVLGRVLDHPAKRVSELTPKNWLAARQGHTEAGG